MYYLANHPADESGDEFERRKSLMSAGEPGHPFPAKEGDAPCEAGPDPSLPTTWMEGSGPVSRSHRRAGGELARLDWQEET